MSEVSTKTHWATIQEAGTLFGLRFLWFVHRYIGRWAVSLFLLPTVVYFVAFRPLSRRASLDSFAHIIVCTPTIGNANRASGM